MVVGGGTAQVVDARQVLLDGGLDQVEEEPLADQTVVASLCARPVVRDEHGEGVVEPVDLAEERDEAADLVVGVGQERPVDLHHVGVEPPLVGREVGPRLDHRVPRCQPRSRWRDAELLLTGEPLVACLVPALGVTARVALDVLAGSVVRRVRGTEREVAEERLARRGGLLVADELDRAVDEVGAEVVAVLG